MAVKKKMLKRKDGTYSKKGLWDNIRANKGSGKKPTKQMLVQEKKIKMGRAQNGESLTKDDKGYTYTKEVTRPEGPRTYQGKSTSLSMAMKIANYKSRERPSDSLKTVTPKMKKNGGPIKKAQAKK